MTEDVVQNVSVLSGRSREVLEFMNEKVMKDYQGMTELAGMYKQDAVFYSGISSDLGTASRQMHGGDQCVAPVDRGPGGRDQGVYAGHGTVRSEFQ